jgi:tetratricopeptide (TPR) repeat protein
VLRITWGDVPTSFRDGMLYLDREEFANAAGSFRQAAADGEARELVRAAARLHAAEALLALGASEPAHFSEAADEAARFLADFPDNREVPAAQMLHARALLLAGQPAEAAAAYRVVHDKLAGGEAPSGYDRAECFRAGLLAAQALLAPPAPDTLGARELFSALAATLGPIVAGGDDSPEMRTLRDVLDEATLGEGFAELAAGNAQTALTFFQNQERALAPDSSDTLRYCVLLGLGESLLADVKPREAQLALAQVSALDHSSPDRVARALLRQAEAGVLLSDPRESIQPLLQTIDRSYGDTPWAAQARSMLIR